MFFQFRYQQRKRSDEISCFQLAYVASHQSTTLSVLFTALRDHSTSLFSSSFERYFIVRFLNTLHDLTSSAGALFTCMPYLTRESLWRLHSFSYKRFTPRTFPSVNPQVGEIQIGRHRSPHGRWRRILVSPTRRSIQEFGHQYPKHFWFGHWPPNWNLIFSEL